MSLYPPSYNLAGSGISSAFAARGRTQNIMVLGDHNLHCPNGMMRALYEQTPNLSGFFCPGILDSGVDQPWAGVSDVTTNLNLYGPFWPYRTDGQPNVAGGGFGTAYIYDTDSTVGDGTSPGVLTGGILVAGGQEIRWPNSASAPGAAQRFCKYTLGSFTGQDAWAQRALTIKPFIHRPNAAVGTNQIVGGPALSLGVWRGTDTPTVAASFSAGTGNAIVAGTAATLAAGSGLPRWGLYWPTSAANSKTRCVVIGAHVTNDMPEGVRFIPFANPYLTLGAIDPGVFNIEIPQFAPIVSGVGGIDAFMIMLGSELDFSPANYNGLTDMVTELRDANLNSAYHQGCVGIWNEVQIDVVNALRGELATSTTPCLFILPQYSGSGRTLAEWEIIHENILKETYFFCTNTVTKTGPAPVQDHKWTTSNCAYIDLNNVATPTEIMTGGLITKGGTTVKGTWSSGTAYVSGDIVNNPNAGASDLPPGGYGAHTWYVAKASSTNKEPGVAADWATYWDKMDFRPTQTFAARLMRYIWSQIAGSASGLQIARPNAVDTYGLRSFRPNQ